MAKKKTKRTATAPRGSKQTQEAIGALREAHRIGKLLLEEIPAPGYGDGALDRAGKKLGMSSATVRKRRVLAKTFATEKELEPVIRLMRQHDSAVGVSVFNRILEVPDSQPGFQKELLRRAIVEKMSRQQVEQVLREKFGTRRQGGKKHQVETAGEFLAELNKNCITITRLCDQASQDESPYWNDVPQKLRKKVESLASIGREVISGIEADRESKQSRGKIRRKK